MPNLTELSEGQTALRTVEHDWNAAAKDQRLVHEPTRPLSTRNLTYSKSRWNGVTATWTPRNCTDNGPLICGSWLSRET